MLGQGTSRKQGRNQRPGARSAGQASRCDATKDSQIRALVAIDASARRREEHSRYRASCRRMEKASSQLQSFEQDDLPAFHRWLEAELAEPLGILRGLQTELDQIHRLTFDVEYYADLMGISYRQAHQKLTAARDAGLLEELWAAALRQGGEPEEATYDASTSNDEDHQDRGGAYTSSPPHQTKRKGATAASGPDYVKTLYRRLVRMLHPDIHPEGGCPELWKQLQEAYDWRDVATMERILQVLTQQAASAPEFEDLSLGDLLGLRREIEAKLRRLRKTLRQAKGHPGWEFSSWSKSRVRVQATRAGLSAAMTMDIQTVRSELRQMQRELASLLNGRRYGRR